MCRTYVEPTNLLRICRNKSIICIVGKAKEKGTKMATTGNVYVIFPERPTVNVKESFTAEDFFTKEKLVKHWQATTSTGFAQAISEGQSGIEFIPETLRVNLSNGGAYFFLMRCLNQK